MGVSAALALVALLAAPVAVADTAPTDPNDPQTPVTVTADSLPTVQINGVVWKQLVVGSTVYAAGSFTSARPAGAAPGVNEVARANLLAYNLTTGALVPGFVANLNAQATALAASPDGTRVYVGGDFTTVNGQVHTRVAALDAATGAPVKEFTTSVNGPVKSLVATAGTLYVGGAFSTVNGTTRNRVAALSAGGAVLAGFQPVLADGAVEAMVLSPDGTKLVLGGSFSTVNGSGNPGYGLGAVDPATGASFPFEANQVVRDGGPKSAILSLSTDATTVYGSGYVFGPGGNLEGSFAADWADLKLKWLEDCHGDTYGVYPSATAVYTASHSHYCGNVGGFRETVPRTFHHGLAWSKARTATVRPNDTGNYFDFGGQPAPSPQVWYPDFTPGTYTGQSQGPWNVTGAGSYVVYGGEFTKINGVGQQGLARFATSDVAPDKEGPRVTGNDFQPTAMETSPGTVTVSWPANWDRDNANLTYTVFQDGVALAGSTSTSASTFFSRPSLSYVQTDAPEGKHVYTVTATDPAGNTVTSAKAVTNESIPVLTAKAPAPGVTGVPTTSGTTGSPVKVTFNEDVTGVSPTTFTLRQGSTRVTATTSYDPATRVATLTPDAPLVADRTYTVLLTSGIQSLSGGSLNPASWNYVTGPAPTVTLQDPPNGTTGVSTGTSTAPRTVSATFSEAVTGLPTTAATSPNFTLSRGGTAVAGRVVYDQTTRVATFTPSAPLVSDKVYTVTLWSGIKDLAGNTLGNKTWTFISGPRPTVTAVSPTAAATGVSTGTSTAPRTVTATFSEPIAGLPTGTAAAAPGFTLKQGTTTVASKVLYDPTTRTATLTPTSVLAADKSYTASLTTAVKDLAGNPIVATSWTFVTGPRPTVSARTPSSGTTGVKRTTNLTATFNEAVKGLPTSPARSSAFTLRQASTGAAFSSVVSYSTSTRKATLNPSSTLKAKTKYTLTLSSGVRDVAGNPMTAQSWTFTTGSS